jgi:large subunit ribosomal protein L32
MAVPKKKHSKARTRRRRSINAKIKLPTLVTSPESGEQVMRHHVDMKSGFYRGRQVFEPEELE